MLVADSLWPGFPFLCLISFSPAESGAEADRSRQRRLYHDPQGSDGASRSSRSARGSGLLDRLVQERLTRAFAQRDGPERGLAEIRTIADRDRFSAYPLYSAAL